MRDPRIVELEAEGYVVLKAKSYRQAQERQRCAESVARYAEKNATDSEAWARSLFDEERRLRDRCEFLYGVAIEHGATREDLAVTVVPWDLAAEREALAETVPGFVATDG